jgi:hypothetical protein
MKKIIRLSVLSAALSLPAFGAPFMAIGDGAELFLTGTVGIRADDNIFLAKNNVDDVIFDINPGLDIVFGKDAQTKGALTLGMAFANYSDHSHLNTELFSGLFNTRYDDGKMKAGFNLSFVELNQNTADLRGLVRRDVFNTGGNIEVEVSQITAVGAGINYDRQNYKRATYSDSKILTIPLDFFYQITEKSDLSLGYRYRDNQQTIGLDSSDHFFNIGARGEFTPKLTGRFAIGYNTRNYDGAGDEDGLGLDASFAYEVSPKTSLQFGASNDFATSPQGQEQENFTLNGAIVSKISEEWSVNGGLSFRSIDYTTRTDDYWEGTLGTTFIMNANVQLVGAYVYRQYESNIRASEFENHVFSFSANLRY